MAAERSRPIARTSSDGVVAVSIDRPVLRVARRPTRWAIRLARERPLTAASFVDAVSAALATSLS